MTAALSDTGIYQKILLKFDNIYSKLKRAYFAVFTELVSILSRACSFSV